MRSLKQLLINNANIPSVIMYSLIKPARSKHTAGSYDLYRLPGALSDIYNSSYSSDMVMLDRFRDYVLTELRNGIR